jgi:hypothetical protein
MDLEVWVVLLAVILAVVVYLRLTRAAAKTGDWRSEYRAIKHSGLRAIAHARSGQVAAGYELLRTSLRRARDLRDRVCEPWADNLVESYQQFLDRYVSRYGSG